MYNIIYYNILYMEAPSNLIVCMCGNTCDRSKKFSVYDTDFCSMKCLTPFKEAEDEKRKPKLSGNALTRFHDSCSGGSSAY